LGEVRKGEEVTVVAVLQGRKTTTPDSPFSPWPGRSGPVVFVGSMAKTEDNRMIKRAQTEDIPALVSIQREVENEQAIWGYGTDPAQEWTTRNLCGFIPWYVEMTQEIGSAVSCPPASLSCDSCIS
jgi:hypothetical protein